MEVLLREPIDLEEVAECLAAGGVSRPPTPARDRSAWHVSNLIESARLITRGNSSYHEYRGAPSGIMSMGRIWESAVDAYLSRWAGHHGGFFIPDQEGEADGIVGSLDGRMFLAERGWLVCEAKLRFSLGEDIPFKHLQQMRAYCYLSGTNQACYVSGHLSSTPPTARAVLMLLRFTEGSITDNWRMLVETRRHLEAHGCGPHPDQPDKRETQ